MLLFHDYPAPMQLMLLAARSRQDAEARTQMRRLCESPMDWQAFLSLAAHHRLSPLVFEGLERSKPLPIPAAVQADLQERARTNAFRALRATHEMCRLVEALAAANSPVAVLKGVPLSTLLYGSPNARHVGDIDLLTRPMRLFEQIDVLTRLGYRRLNPTCRLTPRRLQSYTKFWKDLTFENLDAGFDLDLHWRLFNNRFHAANRILEQGRYESVTNFGCEVRVFSARDQFIYIAAHGISDAWTHLKSLADVAAFLNLFSADELDAALMRAEELGLLPQISAAIHLANDWMGTRVTNPRLTSPTEKTALHIRARTTSSLRRHNFQPQRPTPAQWLRLEMALVPGLRSLVEMGRRFIWRPRVWNAVDLPDRLFWMYPVLGLMLPPRWHSAKRSAGE